MILAAGLGTRLRPLTWFRAKPAVPFLGRPLVRYAVEMARNLGVESPVLNLHHLPDTVRKAAGEGVRYSFEPAIQGTAGAVSHARDLLEGSDTLLLINGKIYFEDGLVEAVGAHRSSGALVTMVVVPVHPERPFNPVYADGSGTLRAIGGLESKLGPVTDSDLVPYVFTGVHLIEPEVIEGIPLGFSDTVRDVYPELIRRGKVRIWVSPAFWSEMSTPARYLETSLGVHRRLNPMTQRALVADPTAMIDPGASVENSVIWAGNSVPAGCSLRRVILADGAGEIPAGSRLEECIVTADPDVCPEDLKSDTASFDGRRIWPLQPGGRVRVQWGKKS